MQPTDSRSVLRPLMPTSPKMNSGPSNDSGAALCMTSEYNGSVLPKRRLLY